MNKPDNQHDANVMAVRQKLFERMQVGLKKYGTTTERTDLTFCDWIRHLQEELMDASVYCERILQDLNPKTLKTIDRTPAQDAALEILATDAVKETK